MNLLDLELHTMQTKLKHKMNNAHQCGHSFELMNISGRQLRSMIGNGLCAYCNKEFSAATDATFERVNPLIGYTLNNTVFCCRSCNNAMSHIDVVIHKGVIEPNFKFSLLKREEKESWLHNLKGKVLDLLFGRELV